jgi:LysM repeat protein
VVTFFPQFTVMAIVSKNCKAANLPRCVASAALGIVLAASISGFAKAQGVTVSGDHVIYVVKKGDTLELITQRFSADTTYWQQIARLNKIQRATSLSVGREIRLPIAWLSAQPSIATVTSVSGTASMDGKPLLATTQILDAQRIVTDSGSVVELSLSDGSSLRIGSAASVVIDRLKQYHSPQIVEARVKLEKGRVEASVTPERKKPFEIVTPGATAAVRGTKFGVSVDAMADPNKAPGFASVDVPTGAVAWIGNDFRTDSKIPAGFGAAALATGQTTGAEALLAAVAVDTIPKEVTKAVSDVSFTPDPLASAYRIQIATDPSFKTVMQESVITKPSITLISKADGPHYLRVKALSANLVEGNTANATIIVAARPVAPGGASPSSGTAKFVNEIDLKWLEIPGFEYRVQMSKRADFATTTLDTIIPKNEIKAPLSLGDNFWRIASIEPSKKQGPFSDSRRIELRPIPNAPAPQVTDDKLEFLPEIALGVNTAQFEIHLAKNSLFTDDVTVQKYTQLPIKLQLSAGDYYVKTRYIIAGFGPEEVPFSPAQKIKMVEPVRNGYGDALKAGDGTSVILGR